MAAIHAASAVHARSLAVYADGATVCGANPVVYADSCAISGADSTIQSENASVHGGKTASYSGSADIYGALLQAQNASLARELVTQTEVCGGPNATPIQGSKAGGGPLATPVQGAKEEGAGNGIEAVNAGISA
eukprot:2420053-Rhodomonas_salina.4